MALPFLAGPVDLLLNRVVQGQVTMRTFCAQDDSCIHFFPGMGYRPVAQATQRDQYGDHAVLIVGDDSPLEGKVPPGWMMTDLPVEPYAPLGGASVLAGLTPATLAGGGFGVPAIAAWGGGGSGGSVLPRFPGVPPDTGGPGNPGRTTPRPELPPIGGDSPEPPVIGNTSTQPPAGPDLPPLAPVPGPEAGVMLISALVVLTLMQGAWRRLHG